MRLNNPNYKYPRFQQKLGYLRDDFAKSKHSYVFVEGSKQSNDYKVFNKVVKENCEIYPAGSKNGIIEDFTLNSFNNQIAILDRDYDDDIDLKDVFYSVPLADESRFLFAFEDPM